MGKRRKSLGELYELSDNSSYNCSSYAEFTVVTTEGRDPVLPASVSSDFFPTDQTNTTVGEHRVFINTPSDDWVGCVMDVSNGTEPEPCSLLTPKLAAL